MSRYRKIEVRLWADEKFMQLSPLPPSGQSLWLYLLAGPHTGPIPGLFRAGERTIADDLNWTTEAFREAFREVFALGLAKANFKAKLVWVPNAIKYNQPESPNVVKSWSNAWIELPECDLKDEAYDAILGQMEERGEAFKAAFLAACKPSGKAIGKPSGKPSGKAFFEPSAKAIGKTCPNQEQEQEQELSLPSTTFRVKNARKNSRKNSGESVDEILQKFGVDGQLAVDFKKHRSAKKAPITETAMLGFEREAGKAGIPLRQAVEISIERGWTGFNAGWEWGKKASNLAVNERTRDSQYIPSAYEEMMAQNGLDSISIDGDFRQILE